MGFFEMLKEPEVNKVITQYKDNIKSDKSDEEKEIDTTGEESVENG